MKSKSSTLRFLYADSEKDANVRYLSGVSIPDAFLSIITERKSIGVVNRLEFGRVAAKSEFDDVLLLEEIIPKAAKVLGLKKGKVGPGQMMVYFAQRFAAKKIEVPADFPALYYKALFEAGYKIKVSKDSFFPEREIKNGIETKAIRQANSASAHGIRAAESVLRDSTIEGDRIVYEGSPLTSERLRGFIDAACLEKNATAQNTIVAGGRQACDPHERGHGLLRPNELIIIDVFPRNQATGYHGDMTRTFLKGRATSEQRRLVKAVRAAQQLAIKAVADGVAGDEVHKAASDYFEVNEFQTERQGDGFVGFVHSTGHGLGLDIHEAPRVGPKATTLRQGQVITIEPGLYYPEIGGCRIEDVVEVTEEGSRKLSSMHYRWEIR